MSGLLATASSALPPLLGVMLGIRTFTGGPTWIALSLLLILMPWLALLLGRHLMLMRPTLGRGLIEVWPVAAVGGMAIATAFGLWLGLEPLPAFLGTPADEDVIKAVTGAFAGGVATYVSILLTKDISEQKGFFSTGAQFRAVLGDVYNRMDAKPQQASPVWEAMFEDTVAGEGELGWDFAGRGRRAEMLESFRPRPSNNDTN